MRNNNQLEDKGLNFIPDEEVRDEENASCRILHVTDLCQFLSKAKIHTFAADAPRSQSLRPPFSKNYTYTDGAFHYEDQYFGEYVDVGEEIVWFRKMPVWGMGYRGGIERDYFDQREEAFEFLRSALRKPESDFPVRGPAHFSDGDYSYVNTISGDITHFVGEEEVRWKGIKVCFRNYIGGIIWGKFSNIKTDCENL